MTVFEHYGTQFLSFLPLGKKPGGILYREARDRDYKIAVVTCDIKHWRRLGWTRGCHSLGQGGRHSKNSLGRPQGVTESQVDRRPAAH